MPLKNFVTHDNLYAASEAFQPREENEFRGMLMEHSNFWITVEKTEAVE